MDILFRTDSGFLVIPVFTFAILIAVRLYFDLFQTVWMFFNLIAVNLFAFLYFGNILCDHI